MTNPDSFFGGAPGLSWPKADGDHHYSDTRLLGVIRGGLITDEPTVQPMTMMGTGAPILWADGRPKQQMVVTLLCDGRGGAIREQAPDNPADQGRRRLYIRGYMVAAIRQALQNAGVQGLRQGGELYVAWTATQPSKTPNFDDARLWAAKYIPPTVGIPEGGAATQPAAPAGAPDANPFGGPVQQPGPPAAPVTAGPPANPFG